MAAVAERRRESRREPCSDWDLRPRPLPGSTARSGPCPPCPAARGRFGLTRSRGSRPDPSRRRGRSSLPFLTTFTTPLPTRGVPRADTSPMATHPSTRALLCELHAHYDLERRELGLRELVDLLRARPASTSSASPTTSCAATTRGASPRRASTRRRSPATSRQIEARGRAGPRPLYGPARRPGPRADAQLHGDPDLVGARAWRSASREFVSPDVGLVGSLLAARDAGAAASSRRTRMGADADRRRRRAHRGASGGSGTTPRAARPPGRALQRHGRLRAGLPAADVPAGRERRHPPAASTLASLEDARSPCAKDAEDDSSRTCARRGPRLPASRSARRERSRPSGGGSLPPQPSTRAVRDDATLR